MFAGQSYVVTLFFICTPPRVVKPFHQVYSPLEPGDILIDLEPLFWTPPGMVLELTLEKGFIRWSNSSVGKQDREMRVYAGLRGDDPVHSRYHVLDC